MIRLLKVLIIYFVVSSLIRNDSSKARSDSSSLFTLR